MRPRCKDEGARHCCNVPQGLEQVTRQLVYLTTVALMLRNRFRFAPFPEVRPICLWSALTTSYTDIIFTW